ncbi:hypothetical protein [Bartonella sp. AP57NXGY]|uniref:hypothetical protein n=1 Tax=Bartonella sp. AP57NXGY TaxID=3243497 RepID=UPI0035D01299
MDGGVTPMGYVVKNRELVIEPDEAEGIRKIFDLFLMTRVAHGNGKDVAAHGGIKQKAHNQKRTCYRW